MLTRYVSRNMCSCFPKTIDYPVNYLGRILPFPLYVEGNPKKIIESHVFYKYCLLCGTKRMTDEKFSELQTATRAGLTKTICFAPKCREDFVDILDRIEGIARCKETGFILTGNQFSERDLKL